MKKIIVVFLLLAVPNMVMSQTKDVDSTKVILRQMDSKCDSLEKNIEIGMNLLKDSISRDNAVLYLEKVKEIHFEIISFNHKLMDLLMKNLNDSNSIKLFLEQIDLNTIRARLVLEKLKKIEKLIRNKT